MGTGDWRCPNCGACGGPPPESCTGCLTAEQRIELEALITEREGMVADNRQHRDEEPHSIRAFMELAGRIRALVPTKENPRGARGET